MLSLEGRNLLRLTKLFFAGLIALLVGLVGGVASLIVVSAATPTATGPGFPFFGPGMMGGGMVGLMGGPVEARAKPIGLIAASDAARRYIAGDGNLSLDEIMEFAGNYYVQVKEQDTGANAFELLVDKYSGAVFPEMGPNMLWNTKYGMGGHMFGGFARGAQPPGQMPISADEAVQRAQTFLQSQDLNLGLEQPDVFYGYYTLHTLRGKDIEGMLSVNGYTGQVWYHTWHGPFIAMQELQSK